MHSLVKGINFWIQNLQLQLNQVRNKWGMIWGLLHTQAFRYVAKDMWYNFLDKYLNRVYVIHTPVPIFVSENNNFDFSSLRLLVCNTPNILFVRIISVYGEAWVELQIVSICLNQLRIVAQEQNFKCYDK